MYKPEEDGVLEEERRGKERKGMPFLFGDAAENGKLRLEYDANREIFRQGDLAESLFYLQQGMVELSVTSPEGKEAIFATLGPGEFFGEQCLAGQRERLATATALTPCTLIRIEKKMMTRMLHEQQEVSASFFTHLLSRHIRYEADLVDQLFNSSEKRLARTLLLLAQFGKESRTGTLVPEINQDHLAQMVGTTRSRVSHFMNNFRKHGYIEYGSGGLTVHRSLRRVVPDNQFLG
jgi:CRP/FNR family cyclic AMP-dependent transcriptional regulator